MAGHSFNTDIISNKYGVYSCAYSRRKRSSQTGGGIVAYDKDAEIETDQAEGNTISNITFLDDNGDSSNLHEFFPPSMQKIRH